MINSILVAGGANKGPLYDYTKVENKALIKIKDRAMIEYVVDALSSSEEVDKIVVIGPSEKLKIILGNKVDQIISSGDSLLENVIRGIEILGYAQKVLITTCDIPLINSEMVTNFILDCEKYSADIYWPIINKKQNLEFYPEVKRTYARVKEGTFTGGNMVICAPSVFEGHRDLFTKVINLRKSPILLFKILGFSFLIKFLLTQIGIPLLPIADTEKRIEEILGGIKVKAIICPYPEVGIDVDKPSDLDLVRNKLEI